MLDDEEDDIGEIGIAPFVKWVLREGITSERVRPLLTLANLLCSDGRLFDLQRDAGPGWLDEDLAAEWLSLAEPQEVALLLRDRIGPYLSPQLFKTVVERTFAASPDIEVLSVLMYFAGKYLDRQPGVLVLPVQLAKQLLDSDDFDHRLGGLIALPHTEASLTDIAAHITAILQRDDWMTDRWAGLNLLLRVFEGKGPRQSEAIEQSTLDRLQAVLTQLTDTAPDGNARRAAEHCIYLLQLNRDKNQEIYEKGLED